MGDVLIVLVKLFLLFMVGCVLIGFIGGLLKIGLQLMIVFAGKAIGYSLPYLIMLALICAPFIIVWHFGYQRWLFLAIGILTVSHLIAIFRQVCVKWTSSCKSQYDDSLERLNACAGARRSFCGSPTLWTAALKAVCMAFACGVHDYEFGSRWGVIQQKFPKIIYIGHRLFIFLAIIVSALLFLPFPCIFLLVMLFLFAVRVVVGVVLNVLYFVFPRSRAPYCSCCNKRSDMVCSCGQGADVHPSIKFGLFVWKCTACGRLIPTFAFLRDSRTRYECPHCGSSVSVRTGAWTSGFHWTWSGSFSASGFLDKLSAVLLAPFRFLLRLMCCPFIATRSLFKKVSRGGANTRASSSGSRTKKVSLTMKGRPVAICCFGDSYTQSIVGKLLFSVSKNSGGVHVDVINAVDPASAYSGQLSNGNIVCRIKRGVIGRTTSLFLLTDTGKHSNLLKKNVDIVMLFVARGVAIESATLSCSKADASNWLFQLGNRMAEIRRCGLMECTVMVLPDSESMPESYGDGARDAEDFLSRADLSDMLSRLFKHVSYKYLTLDRAAGFLLK